MRASFTWLDFLLAGLVAWGCWAVAAQYRASASRDLIFDSEPVRRDFVPVPRSPAAEPVQVADYTSSADRLFFSGERATGSSSPASRPIANQSPPAPLPLLFGIADLGDGPAALLASEPGRRARWISPGQSVGGYLLREIRDSKLVFVRGGRRVVASTAELRAGRSGVSRRRPGAVDPSPRPARATARRNTPARMATARSGYRIGTEFRPGRFAADASDGAQDGTVFEGYVRRVRRTPFGEQHWWEKRDP